MFGAFGQAVQLLFAGDREVYFIAWTSLRLSLVSVVIASALSLPLVAGVPSRRPGPVHTWRATSSIHAARAADVRDPGDALRRARPRG